MTLNFSADALNKMRQSFINKQVSVEEVTSSTSNNVRKKSAFSCQLCSKCFPSKRMLSKHEKYHVDKNTSCKQCGQVFNQKWKLEQHIAKEHAIAGQSLECKECGKQFQWHRYVQCMKPIHVYIILPSAWKENCRFSDICAFFQKLCFHENIRIIKKCFYLFFRKMPAPGTIRK